MVSDKFFRLKYKFSYQIQQRNRSQESQQGAITRALNSTVNCELSTPSDSRLAWKFVRNSRATISPPRTPNRTPWEKRWWDHRGCRSCFKFSFSFTPRGRKTDRRFNDESSYRGRFIEKARSRAFYLKERALGTRCKCIEPALSTFHKNSSVRIRDLTARSLVPSSALAIYPRLVKLAPRIPKTINARFHSGQWGERHAGGIRNGRSIINWTGLLGLFGDLFASTEKKWRSFRSLSVEDIYKLDNNALCIDNCALISRGGVWEKF